MKRFQTLSVVASWDYRVRNARKTPEIRRWELEVWPLCDLFIVQNRNRLRHSGLAVDPQEFAVA